MLTYCRCLFGRSMGLLARALTCMADRRRSTQLSVVTSWQEHPLSPAQSLVTLLENDFKLFYMTTTASKDAMYRLGDVEST